MSIKDKIESIPGYASMSSEAIMDLLNNEPYSHYRSLKSQSPNVSVSGIPFLVSISGSIDGQTRAWNQIVGLDLLI